MSFLFEASPTYCRVVPEPGVMIAFPSYLKHYVHPFFGEGERIVIAANVKVTRI